jgi:hypothetical protein
MPSKKSRSSKSRAPRRSGAKRSPAQGARTAARRAANAPSPQATLPYIGQVELFPYDFVPEGWVACTGELLPIEENATLFTLIGTTYGGDGQNDFALPNLPPRGPSGPRYCVALEGTFPQRA